jgi:2'-5' RNA ligase
MRLFIAIELPEDVRAAIAREQARLRALCPENRSIRWTAADSLHLTLKFIGDTPPERVPALTEALQGIEPVAPFTVAVRGFGFFPDAGHPHVFWAGFEGPPELGQLARAIDAALASTGISRENRPFTPHLTLARFRVPRAEPALLRAIGISPKDGVGSFPVNEYFLFESHLLPGGAQHKKIARFPGGK